MSLTSRLMIFGLTTLTCAPAVFAQNAPAEAPRPSVVGPLPGEAADGTRVARFQEISWLRRLNSGETVMIKFVLAPANASLNRPHYDVWARPALDQPSTRVTTLDPTQDSHLQRLLNRIFTGAGVGLQQGQWPMRMDVPAETRLYFQIPGTSRWSSPIFWPHLAEIGSVQFQAIMETVVSAAHIPSFQSEPESLGELRFSRLVLETTGGGDRSVTVVPTTHGCVNVQITRYEHAEVTPARETLLCPSQNGESGELATHLRAILSGSEEIPQSPAPATDAPTGTWTRVTLTSVDESVAAVQLRAAFQVGEPLPAPGSGLHFNPIERLRTTTMGLLSQFVTSRMNERGMGAILATDEEYAGYPRASN